MKDFGNFDSIKNSIFFQVQLRSFVFHGILNFQGYQAGCLQIG